jgi:lipoyl(octanoyl) transferase
LAPETWRLIRTEPLPGAINMAIDEALLQSVAKRNSAPVLRLYRWSPPTLTLGYGQKTQGSVDFQACRELGIEVVRRSTGGRAVLHENEVTYAVASPDCTKTFPGGILENYRVIAGVLQEMLQSFGIEVHLASGRERRGEGETSVCFCVPSVHELVYRGCKMTGSAQRRCAGAFLQHGSIPVDLDLERLCRALGESGASPQRRQEALLNKVGWLNRFLPVPVTPDQVEERLIATFARRLEITFEPSELTEAEWERVKGNFEF